MNILALIGSMKGLKGYTGIMMALVYGVQGFMGFESGAALGEEAKEPRKAVPFATMGSPIVVGTHHILLTGMIVWVETPQRSERI